MSNLESKLKRAKLQCFTSKNCLKICFDEWKKHFGSKIIILYVWWSWHKGAVCNKFLKISFRPKNNCTLQKIFSWRLGQHFRCFKWTYCAVSQHGISISFIYLHFSHCKFLIFCSMDWFRFQKTLAKGPIFD